MPIWIDTHCHLDAPELAADLPALRASALKQGVRHCVIPAVQVANFEAVRKLAHTAASSAAMDVAVDFFSLGIHPLYVPQATATDLATLEARLTALHGNGRLVAVGEIGLDFFVAAVCTAAMREKQEHFYAAQLKLAVHYQLPVILHVRKSADRLLKYLRPWAAQGHQWHGIAHAFNGSREQAMEFVKLGFKLGFGGAVTYDAARHLRRLVQELPLEAIVLETDAPDIPPQWLYKTAQQRALGDKQGVNSPAELPRIAQVVADLRGISVDALAAATTTNARHALPRLDTFLAGT